MTDLLSPSMLPFLQPALAPLSSVSLRQSVLQLLMASTAEPEESLGLTLL